jgi:hypothetical protein
MTDLHFGAPVFHIRTQKTFRFLGTTPNGHYILGWGKLFCIVRRAEVLEVKPRLTAKDLILLRELKVGL